MHSGPWQEVNSAVCKRDDHQIVLVRQKYSEQPGNELVASVGNQTKGMNASRYGIGALEGV